MLEFIQLEKTYDSRPVLSIPSCRLDRGAYWLQGPNGSGKTTLLRIIAGIISFKGDIRLEGHSLRRDPIAYRRAVSWADAEPRYRKATRKEYIPYWSILFRGLVTQHKVLLTGIKL